MNANLLYSQMYEMMNMAVTINFMYYQSMWPLFESSQHSCSKIKIISNSHYCEVVFD